jgi:hypothetical protein
MTVKAVSVPIVAVDGLTSVTLGPATSTKTNDQQPQHGVLVRANIPLAGLPFTP